MNIVETIKDKFLGGGQEGQAMKMISQLVSESGGVNGLVEKFSAAGFGDTIKSWLSSGKKLPINPDQIQKVLGLTQVQSLANKFGLTTNQVSTELSSKLPQLLEKISPKDVIQKVDELKNKVTDLKH